MSADPAGGWSNFRLDQPGRNGSLSAAESAAAVSAGMAIPCCMDHIVPDDGSGILPGGHIRGGISCREKFGTDGLRHTAGHEFCMVHHLFSSGNAVAGFFLAGTHLAIDYFVHPAIQRYFTYGGETDAALFTVGDLCGVFEFICVFIK